MLDFIVNRPDANEKFMIVPWLCKKCIKTKTAPQIDFCSAAFVDICVACFCIKTLYAHDAAGFSLRRIRELPFTVSENAVSDPDVVFGNAPLFL